MMAYTWQEYLAEKAQAQRIVDELLKVVDDYGGLRVSTMTLLGTATNGRVFILPFNAAPMGQSINLIKLSWSDRDSKEDYVTVQFNVTTRKVSDSTQFSLIRKRYQHGHIQVWHDHSDSIAFLGAIPPLLQSCYGKWLKF